MNVIYKLLRICNDVRAIFRGRIGKRIGWRIGGKVSSRLLGKWFR